MVAWNLKKGYFIWNSLLMHTRHYAIQFATHSKSNGKKFLLAVSILYSSFFYSCFLVLHFLMCFVAVVYGCFYPLYVISTVFVQLLMSLNQTKIKRWKRYLFRTHLMRFSSLHWAVWLSMLLSPNFLFLEMAALSLFISAQICSTYLNF